MSLSGLFSLEETTLGGFLAVPPLISKGLFVLICPLEFKEGHGGWSLFPKTENAGQKVFHAQGPIGFQKCHLSQTIAQISL